LDIDTPEEFVEIKTQLENYDKFKRYDIDGRRQYSNALTHYLYYLQAKELFSELEDEMTIEISLPSTQDKYTNYLRALRTKPFMLLAGISGTGKSRLVRELAFKSCPNIDDLQADKTTPGNYLMIEVKPNWHDSTEILGYYSNISQKYQFTKFIHFLIKAKKYPTPSLLFP
jgi:5-methylcytosine-specific restriction endonuclease McrBC GTP-binding regulatory subunit McrB